MPCEKYREALIAAAAANAVPSRELAAHLETCTICRAFFAEEQELFAAIDSGVGVAVNADVPASLAPRVRAGIEAVAIQRKRWMPTLIFAGTAVVMAIAIFGAVRFHQNAPESQIKEVAAAPAQVLGPPATDTHEASRPGSVGTSLHSNEGRLRGKSSSPPSASLEQAEVIVPSEERDALARFIAARQEESDLAVHLTPPAPDQPYVAAELNTLEIADLHVTPLEGPGSEGPESTEQNR
jgi:hypothetical protein